MVDLFQSYQEEYIFVRVVICSTSETARIPLDMEEYAVSILMKFNYNNALELNAGYSVLVNRPMHVSLTDEHKAKMR